MRRKFGSVSLEFVLQLHDQLINDTYKNSSTPKEARSYQIEVEKILRKRGKTEEEVNAECKRLFAFDEDDLATTITLEAIELIMEDMELTQSGS